jgi:hypothetical protein
MHKDWKQRDKGDMTMDTKKYWGIWGVGLALLLLGWQAPPALGQSQDTPYSTGVVATITAVDANTDMATLRTEAGEVFELPKYSRWTMGDKVLCDRIGGGWRSRLQHCWLWAQGGSERAVTPAEKVDATKVGRR